MASGCLEEIAEMRAAAHRDASQIQALRTDLNARDQDARATRAESAQAREGFEKANAEMRAASLRDASRIRELFDITQALQTDLNARDQDTRAARAETAQVRGRFEKEIAEMRAAAHRDASQIQALRTDLNARDQDARGARAETAQAREGFEKEIAEMRAAAHRELRFQAATGSRALRAESAQMRESLLQKENNELRAAMAAQIQSVQHISTNFHQMGNVMLSSYGDCYCDMQSARAETARVQECLMIQTGELRAARRDALENQAPAALLQSLQQQTPKTTRRVNFQDHSKPLGFLSNAASQTESVHGELTPQKQSAAEAKQPAKPVKSNRMQQAGIQCNGPENRFQEAKAATKNDQECNSEGELPHAELRPRDRQRVQSITSAPSRGNRLAHLGSVAAAAPVSQSPEETCAVCLNPLRKRRHCVSISETQCNHQFHLDCLAGWLQTSSTCPVCTARVSERRLKRRKLSPYYSQI